eukprot:7134352-Prymnesium_polylepis.1
MRRSCVLGATREEQEAFIDVAIGLRGVQLELMSSGQQADVVLIDENIDCDEQEHLKGQEVARTLRERGFHGVVGVMSGSSNQRLTELRETYGIDLVFSKNTPPATVATGVRCAIAARRGMVGSERAGVRDLEVIPRVADSRSFAGHHQTHVITEEMRNEFKDTEEEGLEEAPPKEVCGLCDGVTAAVLEDFIAM